MQHPALEGMRKNLSCKRFITDFTVHDTLLLSENPKETRFLWCTYDNGTVLYWVDNERSIFRFFEIVKGLSEPMTFHFWTGIQLTKVADQTAALDLLKNL